MFFHARSARKSLFTNIAFSLLLLCICTSTHVQAQTLSDPEAPWRYIGVLRDSAPPGTHCPTPSGAWVGEPLFGEPGVVPHHLARFCLFKLETHPLNDPFPSTSNCELGKCGVSPADIHNLEATVAPHLDLLRPDRLVVGIEGTSMLGDIVAGAMHNFFLGQAGRRPYAGNSNNDPKPRLAIVDTKASAFANPSNLAGNSPHGDTLTAMAKTLACSADGCDIDIVNELGLAYRVYIENGRTKLQRDEVRGGTVGAISELARAVFLAIQNWQIDYGDPASVPLVINLSVAWDGKEFGDVQTPLPTTTPDVWAMFEVLKYASCEGVLTLAAAGNRNGGPNSVYSSDPLLPGAWEAYAAPTAEECSVMQGDNSNSDGFLFHDDAQGHDGAQGIVHGVQPPPPSPEPAPVPVEPSLYRPLLYAVGAINNVGEQLLNARDAATPPRVAFGGPATVLTQPGEPPATVLTGTSVSALIASVTGASAWQVYPNRSAQQLMDFLDLGGESPILGRSQKPDFCQGGPSVEPCKTQRPEIQRLSLCQARTSGQVCPAWRNQWPLLSDQTFAPFDVAAKQLSVGGYIPGSLIPSCDIEAHYHSGAPPVQACPGETLNGLRNKPWVFPQPQSPPCPPCIMKSLQDERRLATWTADASTGTLRVELEAGFDGQTLSDPALILCPRDEEKRTLFSLTSWINPTAGDQRVIKGIPDLGCNEATLSFKVLSGGDVGSVISTIMVLP